MRAEGRGQKDGRSWVNAPSRRFVVHGSWACVSTPTTNNNDLPTFPTTTTFILKRTTNRDPLLKRTSPTTQATTTPPAKSPTQLNPALIQPTRNQPTPRQRPRPITLNHTPPPQHAHRPTNTRPQPFGLVRHAAKHQRHNVFPFFFFHTYSGKKKNGNTAELTRRRAGRGQTRRDRWVWCALQLRSLPCSVACGVPQFGTRNALTIPKAFRVPNCGHDTCRAFACGGSHRASERADRGASAVCERRQWRANERSMLDVPFLADPRVRFRH